MIPALSIRQPWAWLIPIDHEADQAYLVHHFSCPTCGAAGRGYGQRCATGAALWAAYNQPTPPTGAQA